MNITAKFLKNSDRINYPDKLVRWIHTNYLRRIGKILDAGAGIGIFLDAWKKIGYDVSACDIAPLKTDIKKVNLNKKWPYKNEEFDYIFLWHVAEHLKEQENWIRESKRCLKEKGKLILCVPDWKSYHKHFFDVYTHCTPYTIPLINDIAKSNRFRVRLNRIFSNIPLLWRYSDLSFRFIMPFKPKSIMAILEK